MPSYHHSSTSDSLDALSSAREDMTKKLSNTRWMVRLSDSTAETVGWVHFKKSGSITTSFPGKDQDWRVESNGDIVASFGSTSLTHGKLYRRSQSINNCDESKRHKSCGQYDIRLQLTDTDHMTVISADTMNGAQFDRISCSGTRGQFLSFWHDMLLFRLRTAEVFDFFSFYVVAFLAIFFCIHWTLHLGPSVPTFCAIVALLVPWMGGLFHVNTNQERTSILSIFLAMSHLSALSQFWQRFSDPKNKTEWNDEVRGTRAQLRVLQALSSFVRAPLLVLGLLNLILSCTPLVSDALLLRSDGSFLSINGSRNAYSNVSSTNPICSSTTVIGAGHQLVAFLILALCLIHAASGALMYERTSGLKSTVGTVDSKGSRRVAKLAFPNAFVYSAIWLIRFIDLFARIVQVALVGRILTRIHGGGVIVCLVDWVLITLIMMRNKSFNSKMRLETVKTSIVKGIPYMLTNLTPFLSRHRQNQEDPPLSHIRYYQIRTLTWLATMVGIALYCNSSIMEIETSVSFLFWSSFVCGLSILPLFWLFTRVTEWQDGQRTETVENQKLRSGQMRWLRGRLSTLRTQMDEGAEEDSEIQRKIRTVDDRITDLFRSKVREGRTKRTSISGKFDPSRKNYQTRRHSTDSAVASYIDGINSCVLDQQEKDNAALRSNFQ
eukprot:GHVL01018865.1.p1 GENE.GHVL01018865.1~~GHVL01018865.1.p1  ORF type:complete len:664 (+),score=48.47 GHVL01018865.1:451-2442(+)